MPHYVFTTTHADRVVAVLGVAMSVDKAQAKRIAADLDAELAGVDATPVEYQQVKAYAPGLVEVGDAPRDAASAPAADPRIALSALTVGRLRELTEDLPVDTLVVLSSDAEGNSHSPLASVDQAMYLPDSPWSGEVYPTREEVADPASLYGEDDEPPDDAVRVLLLGPVN